MRLLLGAWFSTAQSGINLSTVSVYACMISWSGCSHENQLGFLRAVGSTTAEGETSVIVSRIQGQTQARIQEFNTYVSHVAYIIAT